MGIAVKPDGVQRGLVGKIIQRFEDKGFKMTAMKMMTASKEHLENHYADLKGKGFFPGLIKYMGSGPVVAMVWQGQGAVKTGRQMLGATNPADSPRNHPRRLLHPGRQEHLPRIGLRRLRREGDQTVVQAGGDQQLRFVRQRLDLRIN